MAITVIAITIAKRNPLIHINNHSPIILLQSPLVRLMQQRYKVIFVNLLSLLSFRMILIEKTLYLHVTKLKMYRMENKDLNRLKVALA